MSQFPPDRGGLSGTGATSLVTTATTTLAAAPTIITAGNLGSTHAIDLSGASNPYFVVATGTLNAASCALTITGASAGSFIFFNATQDGTGGRTLTINGTTVGLLPDAGAVSLITIVSSDGSQLLIRGPSLLGQKYLITATNATWPVPPGATALEVVCVGGGGQGGGGGTNSAAAANAGGGGGAAGMVTTATVQVGANTTLNVTVGAGGSAAGGGGASGSHVGVAGSNGGATEVTGTGIDVKAWGGSGGAGGPASGVGPAQGGATPNGGGNAATSTVPQPGLGGSSGSSVGGNGYLGLGYQGSGGGGGGLSSTTLGGGGGLPGVAGTGGNGGANGVSGTANGVNGTGASANTSSGGGGGGGAPSGGAGGNGGAGGSGFVVMTVTDLTGAALPIPVPGGAAGPDIWDARVSQSDQVVPFTNASPSNSTLIGVVPNDAKLTNYVGVQGGFTNPTWSTPANWRNRVLAPFGTISARPNAVVRHRAWSTDTSNKNFGQQLHPAAGVSSAYNIGTQPNGNWQPYIGFSVAFPSGTAANGFPAGDTAFPANIRGFYSVYEPFGSGFGSPAIQLSVTAGGWLFGGAPTRTDLSGSTNNYLNLQANGGGSPWVDANPLVLDTWYDFVIYVPRSTTPSPDGIVAGGMFIVYMNGTQQTILPGASQGGYSGALWTRDATTKIGLMNTVNTGGGTGYNLFYQYRAITSANEPVTAYTYPVGAGSTFARVDPSTH